MSKYFRPWNIDQTLLLPPNVQESQMSARYPRMLQRQFGPLITENGVKFGLWAPAAKRVDLLLDRAITMAKNGSWYLVHVPQATAGTPTNSASMTTLTSPTPPPHFSQTTSLGPAK